MTTRAAPATRRNLRIAHANMMAVEGREVADEYIRSGILDAADSDVGCIVQEFAALASVTYMDAMENLAEVGAAIAELGEAL